MRSLLLLLSIVAISLSFSPNRIKRQNDLQIIDNSSEESASIGYSSEENTEVESTGSSVESEETSDESEESDERMEGSGVEVNTDVSPISSNEEESEENDRKKRENNEEPRLLF
ncbi:hypothetical protein PRIPAC_91089 [Pristionchus pacificus]|uniref:Uncharacterized protein n=1 Tax=Pristionchus pacificus TaxID=54126 RepID=A0A454Y0Y7_PRIPA|nr:hypothetical protein PRIPAC_91089 [Pristionchus pacificus]|eukprot:PDM78145.1 hypothetical protein PRIPAC_30530 [Pristionchus pacificus]